MNILFIEPYYGGSHRAWVDGYRAHSQHKVDLLTLPAQFWKWRMQGGAVTMAKRYLAHSSTPDVIVASDMMDVALFRAITRTTIPIVLYFHENQLTYPQNRRQHHGWQYGFINYASALAADHVLFNSAFHMDDFFAALPRMLKHAPDDNQLDMIEMIRAKSDVLPLGLDLRRFDVYQPTNSANDVPLILWNHRWEADKNPTAFFEALYRLEADGIDFRVALTGENFRQSPQEFDAARAYFGERIVQYGYLADFADYAQLLWQADYVVSSAYQDFFGIAVAEAIYAGCVPLLARRLNYPNLIAPRYHDACLFHDGGLYYRLRDHLCGAVMVETAPLRADITRYDWSQIVTRYDTVLASFV